MSPTDKPSKPLDVYVRVSRVGGRDVEAEGGTAAEQEKRCRAQLEALDYKAGQVFVDLDESGGKASRPEFDKAMARALDGSSGGIIVWKLSRFGRRTRHVLKDIAAIEAAGGTFVCVYPSIDTYGAYGKFTLTLFAALDELELDNLTAQWNGSKGNAVERGVVIGPVPTGYRKLADGTLEKVAGDCDRIAAAYARRIAGGSWSEVARTLDGLVTYQENVLTKDSKLGKKGETIIRSNEGTWNHVAARKLLMSPLYRGLVQCGEFSKFVSAYAVVSAADWTAAQPSRGNDRGPSGGVGKYLLAKIAKCGGCGKSLTGISDKGYVYYRCGNGCRKTRVVAAEIEKLVVDAVFARLQSGEDIGQYGEPLDPERVSELEQAVSDAKARRIRMGRSFDPSDADEAAELDALDMEVEEASACLADYLAEAGVTTLGWEEAAVIFDMAGTVEGGMEAQRGVLRSTVAYVTVTGKGADGPVGSRAVMTFTDGTVQDAFPVAKKTMTTWAELEEFAASGDTD